VKVGKLRTGWGSRSGLTATNNSLALTSMPAASGARCAIARIVSWISSPLAPPSCRPKARIKSKLPIEIVVRADERHHTSVRKPRTHASRRASEAPVSARAVVVIRPAPIIIALPRSFATCLANASLHASRYLSARCPTGLLPNRRLLGSDRMVARVGMLRRPTRGLVRWHCLPDRFLHD
jgi:hypothetical protein